MTLNTVLKNKYLKTAPVGGPIIAVIRKEIIVQFPKYMKSDSSIGSRYIMIGFSEHSIKAVQSHISAQELVCHLVYFY